MSAYRNSGSALSFDGAMPANGYHHPSLPVEQPLDVTRRESLRSGLGFTFGIDGVLLHSDVPIQGASQTLQHLTNIGVPFIFLTNSGGTHELEQVVRLSQQLNIPISEDQLVQSHTPLKELAEQHQNDHVLVLGGVGNSCREVAERYGFRSVIIPADITTQYPDYWHLTDTEREYYKFHSRPLPAPINPTDPVNSLKIAAIIALGTSRDWGLEAQLCLDLLTSDRGILGTQSPFNNRSGIPNHGWQSGGQPIIHFASPEFVTATGWPHGPRLGQGAFITALEAIFAQHTNFTGALQSHKIGKPHATVFQIGEEYLIRRRITLYQDFGLVDANSGHLSHVFMVGDNPKTDIEGTNNFRTFYGVNWSSVLVGTGVWKFGQPDGFADWVVADVKAAVNTALSARGLPLVPE